MKMVNTRKLSADEQAALDVLRDRPDCDIDLTDPDAREVTSWSGAVRGALFRPVKKPVAMRLDADILEWFQRQGPGYQTRINAALREYVAHHQR
ncbi:MAG: BrnA antitoxin family protein [Magnetococcales bacterium]|nr:BrnA antitoxin family protein [Magnetococcales bacterium]